MENIAETEELTRILLDIKSEKLLSNELQIEYLDQLEAFECWEPYLRLINRKLDDANSRSVKDFARLARVQIYFLENLPGGAQTCVDAIEKLKLSYAAFRDKVLGNLLETEDYEVESHILRTVCPVLASEPDRIQCLERLCLIFEKKKYDETLLSQYYDQLYRVDANNQKALRYFKMVHTQNGQWHEVVEILEKLYQSASHKNDQFRIAQEQATVYLYQLDEPERAITILESRCQGSPLETSTIWYEACYQIQDWKGCLAVLKSHSENVEERDGRAILYYKMAQLELKLDHTENAEKYLTESSNLYPHFLEAHESLIELNISEKEWYKAMDNLEALRKVVNDTELSDRISEAISRLAHGLRSG